MVDDSSGNPPIRWEEFGAAYAPALLLWTTGATLLALPTFSFHAALAQALFLLLWSYWGHRFAHTVSAHFPFNILNPHVSVHHNHEIEMSRWLSLVLEAVVNFMGFFILEIAQRLLGVQIFSTSALLGAAFLYINIHILDYSIHGDPAHGRHHEKTFCNYDPEWFDTLFGTRCDPERPYTNLSHQWFHASIAFTVALAFKFALHLT